MKEVKSTGRTNGHDDRTLLEDWELVSAGSLIFPG